MSVAGRLGTLAALHAAAFLLLVGVAQAGTLPGFAQVRAAHRPSDGVLRDRYGEIVATLRLDRQFRRLEWVPLDEISPALTEALLVAEDRRFHQHGGVDWLAAAGALWDNLRGTSKRGASSLSMQLAAMLDPALARRAKGRTLAQKWDQIRAAHELEQHWSKDQILEAYVNLLTYRGELQGIGAASWGLFGKHPSGLNRNEASILAALVRQPAATASAVGKRACALARQLEASSTCERISMLADASLDIPPNPQPAQNIAPHLARRLLSAQQRDVWSSLDAGIQRLALDSLKQQLASLAPSGVEDGAAIVLDNASGEILAYVGSSGELSRSAQVDGITARRQAGSTLKPFLYQLALEKRLLTAATVLDDTPYNLATSNGLYVPQDYDREFKGPVSARTALASSLNIPAVRTIVLTGVPAFHQRLRELGFTSLVDDPEHYGFSLALGAADVSLLELANAYRTLANLGRASTPRFQPGNEVRFHRVLNPAATFIVADMLSDRAARYLTFGFDNPLATRSWAAAKTGTSKDMRDNWALGFSERYTVGVWVGNFSGAPMHNVSGVTGAAPVWAEIINTLHRDNPGSAPTVPTGINRRQISFENNLEAARREWFLAGTEADSEISWRSAMQGRPRITYPTEGTILAIDPDIPEQRQSIPLRAEGAASKLAWMLDGERLPNRNGDSQAFIRPAPGKHHLALVDQEGRELDGVTFHVRGHGEPLFSAEGSSEK